MSLVTGAFTSMLAFLLVPLDTRELRLGRVGMLDIECLWPYTPFCSLERTLGYKEVTDFEFFWRPLTKFTCW
jgi:hypothetical protein